jgi:uncharacterized protein (UPF0332 family)
VTPEELMTKAHRALASAKLLLDSGDVDGACNRAYYAMFDAARAALLSTRAPVPAEVARTHSGLISAFSLHLVKPGLIAVEHGRSLNKVEDLRLIADYKGDPVSFDHAAWALEQASNFLLAIQALPK